MAGTSREKNFKAVKLLPLTNAGFINKDIWFKENNRCFLVLMGAWKQNENLAKFFAMIFQKTETKEKEVATHLFLMSSDWSTAIIASKSVNNFIQPPIKASKTCLPQTLTITPLLYNVMITVKNHISWCLVSTSIAVNVIRNIGLVRRPTRKTSYLWHW